MSKSNMSASKKKKLFSHIRSYKMYQNKKNECIISIPNIYKMKNFQRKN